MSGRFSTTPLRCLAGRHQLVGMVEGIPRQAGWLERRGLSVRSLNFRAWAQSYLVPMKRIRSGHEPGLADWLARLRPDVLCVANFPHLLPASLFQRWPTLNLHPSLLPRWRGAYPWFWMYHAMDAEGGWTVHRIDSGEDTGPILARQTYPVPFGSTVTELGDAVLQPGGELFADTLDRLGELPELPQPDEKLPRARRPRPGERYVDWESWPVRRVYHFLRGVCPLWLREPDLGPLWEPEIVGFDEEPPTVAPGQRVRGYVACRDGRLFLRRRWRF